MLILLMIQMASASTGYPAEIAAYLGLACEPQCTACHVDNGGGNGTVTQPFGVALMDRGLTGGSQNALLDSALDAVHAEGVDSDGDGVIDTDALAGGVDPNTGTAFCDVLKPIYGCVTVSQQAGWGGVIASGLMGLALFTRRGTRTRRP